MHKKCGLKIAKRPLVRYSVHKLENNIKMDLNVRSGGVEWINLDQGRFQCLVLVNTVMNLPFP
jgi:hypothetical protein